MSDAPEIPQPDKAPPDAKEVPPVETSAEHASGNGNGNFSDAPKPGIPAVDAEKLIDWVKATDKELKIMRLTQLALCAGMLFLLVTTAKTLPKVPTP